MKLRADKPSDILSRHNIKPSYQRIKIYEYLSSHFIHPTVDCIFEDLKDEIPTLSKSTVYNTLKTFVKANLIREINIENLEIRYEFNTKDHGHFKCNNCGNIYDFNIDTEVFLTKELEEFQIDDKNVYFKGLCKNCTNKI